MVNKYKKEQLKKVGKNYQKARISSGTTQEDVGNIKLIEEYIVSMATPVDSNRWFPRSASSVCSTQ